MFSHSRINCFKQCPKLYQYKYIDNLEPIEYNKTALNVGSAFHHGVEMGSSEEAIKYMDDLKLFANEKDETNKVLVEAMVEAYLKKFPDDRTKMRYEVHVVGNIAKNCNYYIVHHDENGMYINDDDYFIFNKDGNMELNDGSIIEVDYQGFVDGLEEDDDGYWEHENKTASMVNDVYIKKLDFIDQPTRYWYMLEKVLDKPILGCKYRVVKKPKLRQKQSESVIQYRNRLIERLQEDDNIIEEILKRTPDEITDAIDDMKYDMNTIKGCTRYTKNLTACSMFGQCPFMDLCAGVEDAEYLFKEKGMK